MRLFICLGLVLASINPVFAGATPWQDVAPDTRLRLITSDVRSADGVTLIGLELDMPASFKTYWQLPGETGLLTDFDTAGSRGVGKTTIEWPYPTPEVTQGLLDYVYHGPTVLPIKVQTIGNSPVLNAKVTMGVCSEVCVPVRAEFSLPLSFETRDAGQFIRLRQAEALVPQPWSGGAPPFVGVTYDAAARGLRLSGMAAGIDPASIIVSTTDPTVVFDAPQKSPDGRALLLPLRGQQAGTGWAARSIDLTFMTADGAFVFASRVIRP